MKKPWTLRFVVAGITATLLCPGVAPAVTIYLQDFEVDPTAAWTVNSPGLSDVAANFSFDYGTVGIPLAPNSGSGDSHGMKLQANLSNGVFSGFSVSPTGQSFTGDYTLAFDWWANFNGPFPIGGSGSTNLSTFGIGTSGVAAQWPGVADSLWFAATGDGGSVADWRVYSPDEPASYSDGDAVYAAPTRNNSDPYYASLGGVSAPAAQLALYPQQTGLTAVGSAGMAWHQVEIDKAGSLVTWSVDGLLISTVDLTGLVLGGDNIFFGHSDVNATSSSDPYDGDLLFTLIDNVRVDGEGPVSVPEPGTLLLLGTGLAGLVGLRRKFTT